jgi:glycosyltransferase involved in cell wall biosynthesis
VPRLRVGIDGRAFSSPAAGVRRYVQELSRALAICPDIDLVALGGRSEDVPEALEHVVEGWHPPTNLGWTAVGLPRTAARARVGLIHAPAYTGPLASAVPVVVTIHDVSYERHPEWYPYRRDWLRRAFYRRSARSAAHVLTDSEYSRSEIAAAYDVPSGRITVVPLGVAETFGPDETPVSLPTAVSPPFLLHVGDLHERRNVARVIAAISELRRRSGPVSRLSLVLAGVDRGVGDTLASDASSRGLADAVVRLGAVSEAQLRALYRGASALVYPSKYEGFGLPLLEAMASGTPVMASRAASIPEVVGDAGILLDPDDTPSWVDAIDSVLNDQDRRDQLVAAGRLRASQFTWGRTARETADVYRRVAQ